jgi:hypothetical protein
MRRMGSLLVFGIALTAAVATQATAQAPPPELTGESLGGVPTFVANCVDGRSTISYMATGDAEGPYPGTFTETGTVTMGPVVGEFGVRALLKFRAEFTIDSPLGHISGTKKQVKDFPDSGAQCLGETFFVFLVATYRAVISTDAGHCKTQGTAGVNLSSVGAGEEFGEGFLTGTPPVCGGSDEDEDGDDG